MKIANILSILICVSAFANCDLVESEDEANDRNYNKYESNSQDDSKYKY